MNVDNDTGGHTENLAHCIPDGWKQLTAEAG